MTTQLLQQPRLDCCCSARRLVSLSAQSCSAGAAVAKFCVSPRNRHKLPGQPSRNDLPCFCSTWLPCAGARFNPHLAGPLLTPRYTPPLLTCALSSASIARSSAATRLSSVPSPTTLLGASPGGRYRRMGRSTPGIFSSSARTRAEHVEQGVGCRG